MHNSGTHSSLTSTALRLLGVLALLWAGLVIGISFLEAPIKFSAPSVTRPIGLDVGRHVFRALNRLEWVLWIATLVLIWTARPERRVWYCLALAWSTLFLQTVWLLPLLDARAALIIAGGRPPDSTELHVVYGLIEITKVIALTVVGWLTGHLDSVRRSPRISRTGRSRAPTTPAFTGVQQ